MARSVLLLAFIMLGQLVAERQDVAETKDEPEAEATDALNPTDEAEEDEENDDDQDYDDSEGGDEVTDENREIGGDDDDDEQAMITEEQMRALHAKIDANGDGKVHVDELHAHRAHVHEQATLSELRHKDFVDGGDHDGDGKLSVQEFAGVQDDDDDADAEEKADAAKALELAKAADLNGDGFLTGDAELMAALRPASNAVTSAIQLKHEFNDVDADKSGTISKKEFAELADDRVQFEHIDANKDGVITLDEYGYLLSNKAFEDISFQELVSTLDKDGDSHLTADEIVAAHGKLAAFEVLAEFAGHHEL